MRLICIIIILFSYVSQLQSEPQVNQLQATFEKYLKPAVNKTAFNSMHNIDFLYIINLDQRPEKFATCSQQLTSYNITPYRFSAVNGWELLPEALNSLGVTYEKHMKKDLWGTSYSPENNGMPSHEIMNVVGKNYFCHCMSRGAIGIALSHLSVLKDALDSGYKKFIVMEDDIEVIKNPHRISKIITKLDRIVGKKGWDILFTDRDTKDKHGNYVPCRSYAKRPNFDPKDPSRFTYIDKVGKNFVRINARYGAYSMVVKRSGAKKSIIFLKSLVFFCRMTWTIICRIT